MKKRFAETALLILFILIGLTSCGNLLNAGKQANIDGNTLVTINGTISLSGAVPQELISSSARGAAFPKVNLDAFTFSASALKTGESTPVTGTANSSSFSIDGLFIRNEYTITVEAKLNGKTVFRGGTTLTLSLTNVQAISVEMTPLQEGTGSISLKVGKGDVDVTKIVYQLDDESPVSITDISSETVISLTSVASGKHMLNLKFYNTETDGTRSATRLIYDCTEAINVFPNMTTDSWLKSSSSSGDAHLISSGSALATFQLSQELTEPYLVRTVYVDGNASGSLEDGSIFEPFKTISKAMKYAAEQPKKASLDDATLILVTGGTREVLTEKLTLQDVQFTLDVSSEGANSTAVIDAGNYGIAFRAASEVSLKHVDFTKNVSSQSESFISLEEQAKVTAEHCSFTGGYAERGSAFNNAGTIVLSSCTFSNNTAVNGGAVYNQENATITECTFDGNSASSVGGAVYNDSNGTLSFTGGRLTNNSAATGGAIQCGGTSVTIKDCSDISGNRASSEGGALCTNGSIVTVTNCKFTGNSALTGGAVSNNSLITINDSKFTSNSATNKGGAVWNDNEAYLNDSSFEKNKAGAGGAIYIDFDMYAYCGLSEIKGCSFTGNSASVSDGGAIYNKGVTTLTDSPLTGNTAQRNGGAIYNGSTIELDSCTVKNNTAQSTGAAFYNYLEITLKSSTFQNNTATGKNAAFYSTAPSDSMGAPNIRIWDAGNIMDEVIILAGKSRIEVTEEQTQSLGTIDLSEHSETGDDRQFISNGPLPNKTVQGYFSYKLGDYQDNPANGRIVSYAHDALYVDSAVTAAGTGSFQKPYKSIHDTLAAINNASGTEPVTVFIKDGTEDESWTSSLTLIRSAEVKIYKETPDTADENPGTATVFPKDGYAFVIGSSESGAITFSAAGLIFDGSKSGTAGTGAFVEVNENSESSFNGCSFIHGRFGDAEAISVKSSTLNLTDCSFSDNHSEGDAAALLDEDGNSHITLDGCSFTGNMNSDTDHIAMKAGKDLTLKGSLSLGDDQIEAYCDEAGTIRLDSTLTVSDKIPLYFESINKFKGVNYQNSPFTSDSYSARFADFTIHGAGEGYSFNSLGRMVTSGVSGFITIPESFHDELYLSYADPQSNGNYSICIQDSEGEDLTSSITDLTFEVRLKWTNEVIPETGYWSVADNVITFNESSMDLDTYVIQVWFHYEGGYYQASFEAELGN